MTSQRLNKDSLMECQRHGTQKPSFVCRHLHRGAGLGFNQPADAPDPEVPFQCAWCDGCQRVLATQGFEWNDISEAHGDVVAICESCLDEIRRRNS